MGALLTSFTFNAAADELFNPGSIGTHQGNGRKLTSFALKNDGETAEQAIAFTVNQKGTSGENLYFDLTNSAPFVTKAGNIVNFSDIDYSDKAEYAWMHGFLFIDYNKDGGFNSRLNTTGINLGNSDARVAAALNPDPDGGELVSFWVYNVDKSGSSSNDYYVNSVGTYFSTASNGVGCGIHANQMPPFTIPSYVQPGVYDALFKIDWSDISQHGNPGDSNGNNFIGKNGGCIVKFKIQVVDSDIVQPGPTGSVVQLSALDGLNKITYFNDYYDEDPMVAVRANRSTGNNTITIMGQTYESGVGTHAPSKAIVALNGATSFHCVMGVDDEIKSGSNMENGRLKANHGVVTYTVGLYGESVNDYTQVCTGTLDATQSNYSFTFDLPSSAYPGINLANYQYMVLEYGAGEQPWADHADWADAYFEYDGTKPHFVTSDEMFTGTTTPPTISGSLLDGATTLFSLPNVRFMHKLLASVGGATISVEGLPEGLKYNEERELVEGFVSQEGEYNYTVVITTSQGVNRTPVTLTVSSDLQQPTPFMGWLSWNVIEGNISNQVVRQVADAMVEKGLKAAGYNYLVIDDLWHAPNRNNDGTPREDPSKFPDGMAAAAQYAHDKGLKFGIYSDAGTLTCARAFGSYGYEEIDAQQYAKWGVDLLKYDYCNAPEDVATAKSRYKKMGDALKSTDRNILFYICEWGVRKPWEWGAEVGGTNWRCTYDTRDFWTANEAAGGIGVVQSIKLMKNLWPYNGVNRWNDADMMCIGIHGTGKSSKDLGPAGVPSGMTQDEYGTQFALWCMWSSPLTLSFDVRQNITAEDLAMMTNEELIALNQDPMGQAAELVYEDSNIIVFAKDLANGDVAVSVTNLSSNSRNFNVNFSNIPALDNTITYQVRDVVKHQDLNPVTGSITASAIPSHATVVYRLSSEASLPTLKWTSESLVAKEVTSTSAKVDVEYLATNVAAAHTLSAVASPVEGSAHTFALNANENAATLEFTNLEPNTTYSFSVTLKVHHDGEMKTTSTALPLEFTTTDSDAVVDIEAEENGTPRYYNLQGIEVEEPASGIYIRVVGNKATKVVIR